MINTKVVFGGGQAVEWVFLGRKHHPKLTFWMEGSK